MIPVAPHHPLRRYLAGVAEQTFMVKVGIGDPKLVDYLAGMLARFIHMDELYRLRGDGGQGRAV